MQTNRLINACRPERPGTPAQAPEEYALINAHAALNNIAPHTVINAEHRILTVHTQQMCPAPRALTHASIWYAV